MWWYDDKILTGPRGGRRRRSRESVLYARSGAVRDGWRGHLAGIALVSVAVIALCGALFAAAMYAGRKLFTENPRFNIAVLDLQSDGTRLSPDHLREYSGLSAGQNLFAVDISEVRRKLELVPLVGRVTVRRSFPDTLEVRVSERSALACLKSDRSAAPLAVDREGYVLGPMYSSPNLPVVEGFSEKGLRPGSQVRAREIRDALSVLDIVDSTPALARHLQIMVVNVRDRDRLDVRLANGKRLLLAPTRLEWRLQRAASSLQADIQKGGSHMLFDVTGDSNVTGQ